MRKRRCDCKCSEEERLKKMAYKARWKKQNPEAWARNSRKMIWLERGITISMEQYQAMLVAQNHRCAICGDTAGKKALAVDHDHATGQIRALLCSRCNPGIGYFLDSPARLEAAARYLRGFSSEGK